MAILKDIEPGKGGRRRFALHSPATLDKVGELEVATAEEVTAAVGRARAAQPAWAALSFKERGRYLRRALDILRRRREEFLEVVMGETGKVRMEALTMEIFASLDFLNYWAKRAGKILAERKQRTHLFGPTKQLRIVYRPLGVVAIITPWNGPFVLSLNPTAQALMAGNAVVLKPSEITPYSGKLVGDLFAEAGLPQGLVEVVAGDGSTGAALAEADVDKVSFTGSVATGRRVAEACARRLVPCTLELGGNDPLIVCHDADLERAATGAVFGSLLNAGQVCCSAERVYVVDTVADEFTEKVAAKVRVLRQSPDGRADIGAIIRPEQLAIIERHVADALSKGAEILVGGRRNPDLEGLFFEPTVMTGLTPEMSMMREETFGPIIAIVRVKDEEEALRLANDSDYGLNSSVWTENTRRGLDLARRIEAGSTCINDCAVTYGVTEAPFGGVKNSGLGQMNGASGLRGYCHALPIVRDRLAAAGAAGSYPYDEKKEKGLLRVIKVLWGTPLGRWMA